MKSLVFAELPRAMCNCPLSFVRQPERGVLLLAAPVVVGGLVAPIPLAVRLSQLPQGAGFLLVLLLPQLVPAAGFLCAQADYPAAPLI